MAEIEKRKQIENILIYAVRLWHLYYVTDWLEEDLDDLGEKCTDDAVFLKSFDGSEGEKIAVGLPDICEKIRGTGAQCRKLAYGMEDMVKSALRGCRTVIPEVYGSFAEQLTDDDIDNIYEYLCDGGFSEAYDHCTEEIFLNLTIILRTRAFYAKTTVLSSEDVPDFDEQFDFQLDNDALPFC